MEFSPVFTHVGLEMSLNSCSSCFKTAHPDAKDAHPISLDLQRPDFIKKFIQFAATGPTGAGNESSTQKEMPNGQVDDAGLLGRVTEDNASSS